MSKKQERCQKLVKIHELLSSVNAIDEAKDQATLSLSMLRGVRNELLELLALDGVSAVRSSGKVNS